MELQIFLPFRVFARISQVSRVVAETHAGSFGILPQRLDCVAAVTAGILTYETPTNGVAYIAIDGGVLIKAGPLISLSVRNAFAGADLQELRSLVEKEFLQLDAQQKDILDVTAKLEGAFLSNWEKLRKQ